MVDASTATTMMNNAGPATAPANPYGPPSNPYAPAAGAASNIVTALLNYIKQNKHPAGLGSFEGNVASPANPYNSGTYGMPGQDPSQGGASQAPQDPAFSGGASAVPYTDPTMQALFSQPPTG